MNDGSEPGQVYDLGAFREGRERGEQPSPLPPLIDVLTDGIDDAVLRREAVLLADSITKTPDQRPDVFVLEFLESLNMVNSRLDIFERPGVLRSDVERARVSRIIDIENNIRFADRRLNRWTDDGTQQLHMRLDELLQSILEDPVAASSSLLKAADYLIEQLPTHPVAKSVRDRLLLVIDDHMLE
jgi:hypothetical protein